MPLQVCGVHEPHSWVFCGEPTPSASVHDPGCGVPRAGVPYEDLWHLCHWSPQEVLSRCAGHLPSCNMLDVSCQIASYIYNTSTMHALLHVPDACWLSMRLIYYYHYHHHHACTQATGACSQTLLYAVKATLATP